MKQEDLEVQRNRWEGLMDLPVQVGGVFFALDIVFLQNLVQGNPLNLGQTFSLVLFAIALPCLAANAFIMIEMRLWKEALPEKSKLFFVVQYAGYYASIAGVGLSIFAVSWWIGVLFISLSAFMMFFCSKLIFDMAQSRTQRNTSATS